MLQYILGQYNKNGQLEYMGRVALGISKEAWHVVKSQKEIDIQNADLI